MPCCLYNWPRALLDQGKATVIIHTTKLAKLPLNFASDYKGKVSNTFISCQALYSSQEITSEESVMWRNVEVKDWVLRPVLDSGASLNGLETGFQYWQAQYRINH